MRDMTAAEFDARLAANGWERCGTSRTDGYFDSDFKLHRIKDPVDVPNFRYRITDPVVRRAIDLKVFSAHRGSLHGHAVMLGKTMLRRQTLALLTKSSEAAVPKLRQSAEIALAGHFLRTAAPDLLAAARLAEPLLSQACSAHHPALAALQAAIAKAEGREVEPPPAIDCVREDDEGGLSGLTPNERGDTEGLTPNERGE